MLKIDKRARRLVYSMFSNMWKRAAAAKASTAAGSPSMSSLPSCPRTPSRSPESPKRLRTASKSDNGSDSDSLEHCPGLSDSDQEGRDKVKAFLDTMDAPPAKVDTVHVHAIHPGEPDPSYFWSGTLRLALAARWDRMHRCGLLRTLQLEGCCDGIGAFAYVVAAMRIPHDGEASGSDPKAHAKELLASNCAAEFYGHMFDTIADQASSQGRCYNCGTSCRSEGWVCGVHKVWYPHRRRDIVFAGTPCQPVSRLQGNKVQMREHALWYVTFGQDDKLRGLNGDSLIDYVSVCLPGALLIEQVCGFGEPCPRTGEVALRLLATRIMAIVDPFRGGAQHFISAKVFEMDCGRWMNMSRPRFMIARTDRT